MSMFVYKSLWLPSASHFFQFSPIFPSNRSIVLDIDMRMISIIVCVLVSATTLCTAASVPHDKDAAQVIGKSLFSKGESKSKLTVGVAKRSLAVTASLTAASTDIDTQRRADRTLVSRGTWHRKKAAKLAKKLNAENKERQCKPRWRNDSGWALGCRCVGSGKEKGEKYCIVDPFRLPNQPSQDEYTPLEYKEHVFYKGPWEQKDGSLTFEQPKRVAKDWEKLEKEKKKHEDELAKKNQH